MRRASTAGNSRTLSRAAPSTASIRTGRRLLPRRSNCCARRASPPKSARAARRASSPASIRALPRAPDCRPVERLHHEFAAIGFFLSSHPLDPYGKSLERAGIIRWADLPAGLAAHPTNRFRLAGLVIGRKERTSGRGNRFAFVQMSDPSGTFEVTLFSEILREAR